MGWFSRRKTSPKARGGRSDGPQMTVDRKAVEGYLRDWVASHRSVEAYVEPATNVTATTVVLIAFDGEWTRRALPSRKDAFEVAKRLEIPVYDVNQTGYPQRMRDWTSRQRRGGA